MRKITHLSLITVYGIFITLLSFRLVSALFNDSANSNDNTFTAAAEFPSTPTPTGGETPPASIAAHLVISEVQTATSSSVLGDFIELYNPTSPSISLNGMRLVKRTSSGTSDTEIKAFGAGDIVPANGYYLWASSDNGYNNQIHANATTGQNIADNNSVALRNGPVDSGTVIDQVAWGAPTGTPLVEGTAFTPNPTADQGIERKALSTSDASSMTSGADVSKGNGYDTNNNATDFILRTTSEPQNSSSTPEST